MRVGTYLRRLLAVLMALTILMSTMAVTTAFAVDNDAVLAHEQELYPLNYTDDSLNEVADESDEYDNYTLTMDELELEEYESQERLLQNYTMTHWGFDGVLNHGATVTGNRIYNTGGNISFVPGRDGNGQALLFDGNSGVNLGSNLINSYTYTISLWINPSRLTGATTAFIGGVEMDRYVSIVPRSIFGPHRTYLLGVNRYRPRIHLGSGNTADLGNPTGTGRIPLNEWTHLVAVVDGQNARFYINGINRGTANNFPTIFAGGNAEYFALGVNWLNFPFMGMMDDLTIWDNARLTSDGVRALYEGNTVAPEDVIPGTHTPLEVPPVPEGTLNPQIPERNEHGQRVWSFSGDLGGAIAIVPENGLANIISNDITRATPQFVADRHGNAYGALRLDGTYGIYLGAGIIDSRNYTISFWMRPETSAENSQILPNSSASVFFAAVAENQWLTVQPATNFATQAAAAPFAQGRLALRAHMGNLAAAQQNRDYVSNRRLIVDEWQHIAISVSFGHATFYVNGQRQAPAFPGIAGGGSPTNHNRPGIANSGPNMGPTFFCEGLGHFFLGVSHLPDVPNFVGTIDDLRIINSGLSATEIAELANFNGDLSRYIAPGLNTNYNDPPAPTFTNATTHDPSITRSRVGSENGYLYVVGTFLQGARTRDLMNWEQINYIEYTVYENTNNLVFFPEDNPDSSVQTMSEQVRRVMPGGPQMQYGDRGRILIWAADLFEMPDGRFFLYYSISNWGSPRSGIGLAISTSGPEGPFVTQGLIVTSQAATIPPNTTPTGVSWANQQNRLPNAIDSYVFFCSNDRFWMLYGSWFGGFFIMELNPTTGIPIPHTESALNAENDGHGRKLIASNHISIEGGHIQYSEASGYYYLFGSWGSLAYYAGYNVRVFRSRNPYGPFEDARFRRLNEEVNPLSGGGNTFNMIDLPREDYAGYPAGELFQFNMMGNKILGSYQFVGATTELQGRGYHAPGHGSTFADPETGRYFKVFHTRFSTWRGGSGGSYAGDHEIRVHEMFLNDEGWFVLAPLRYDGSVSAREFTKNSLVGHYSIIHHGRVTSVPAVLSSLYFFGETGAVYYNDEAVGTWELRNSNTADISIRNITYSGVFLRQYCEINETWVQTFTAMSYDRENPHGNSSTGGLSIWGRGVSAGLEFVGNVTEPTSEFTGTNPRNLSIMLENEDVILATERNLGIFAQHSPFVIPEGRTLYVRTVLNISGNAELIIKGNVVVLEGGRINNQGGSGGTITIANGGTLINYGHVENVSNSTIRNCGTIINNGRFEIRADVTFVECGNVEGRVPLSINRNANRVECEDCEPEPAVFPAAPGGWSNLNTAMAALWPAYVHDSDFIYFEGQWFKYDTNRNRVRTTTDMLVWTNILNATRIDSQWAPNAIMLDTTGDGVRDTVAVSQSLSTFGSRDSVISVRLAPHPTGPFGESNPIMASGARWQTAFGTPEPEGMLVNALDGSKFYCSNDRLWMVYGSYSSGIYVIELNPRNALLFEQNAQTPEYRRAPGIRVAHRNVFHGSLEGAHILYNPTFGYYYLNVTYGSLESTYNVRIGRSENPTGPFFDFNGNNMNQMNSGVTYGQSAQIGTKIIAPFMFDSDVGWSSTGHSSFVTSPETGLEGEDEFFIAYNARRLATREATRGGRVKQGMRMVYWTDDGWPMTIASHFTGIDQGYYRERQGQAITPEMIPGNWEIIENLRYDPPNDPTVNPRQVSRNINLRTNGTVDGDFSGTWNQTAPDRITMVLDGMTFDLYLIAQWDWELWVPTIHFAGFSTPGPGHRNGLLIQGKRLDGATVLENVYNSLDIQASARGNVYLPTAEFRGVNLEFTSSNTSILGNDGVLASRPAVDTTVTMTVAMSIYGYDGIRTRSFDVVVRAAPTLTAGITGQYAFENLQDTSGHNRHLSRNPGNANFPALNRAGIWNDSFNIPVGAAGNGAWFEVSGDIFEAENFTFTGWINRDNHTATANLFGIGDNQNFISFSGNANVFQIGVGGLVNTVSHATLPHVGGWTFVAVTIDGNVATLYMMDEDFNGNPYLAQRAQNVNFFNSPIDALDAFDGNTAFIGRNGTAAANAALFRGYMDEFVFHNTALSLTQLEAEMNRVINGRFVRVEGLAHNNIGVGETQQLFASVMEFPSTPTVGALAWTTGESAIATVNNYGLISGITEGSTTVTATHGTYGSSTADVIVTTPVSATSVVIGPGATTTMRDIGSVQLTATIAPANATQRDIIWTVESGYGYIAVNEFGVVTPVSRVTNVAQAVVRASVRGTSIHTDRIITITPALVSHLQFDGNLGDSSFNNLDAIPRLGAPAAPNSDGIDFVPSLGGPHGQALTFTAIGAGNTGASLRLNNRPPNGRIISNTQQYTAMMWIRPSALTAHTPVFFAQASPTLVEPFATIQPWAAATGTPAAHRCSGPHVHITAPDQLVVEQWVHLAKVIDGNRVDLYVNGELVARGIFPQNNDPLRLANPEIWIGSNLWDYNFNGLISEFRLYGAALGASYIAEIVAEHAHVLD
ncbi:MAG: family 43 glycosylhydrolase [Oscillospiraceae bacterium]|nr:family 43 glycosylhydrolase [Oscillospiraceae bacterium]